MLMKRFLFALSLTFCVCSISKAETDNLFLQYLLDAPGGVTLVYGNSPSSRNASEIVKQKICTIEGHRDWDNMISDAEFDALSYEITGQTHVVVVGTLRDSEIMRGRNWLSTWFLDRDWYFNEYEHGAAKEELMPYAPTTGFVVGGFGEWPKEEEGIGYVEVDRSFLFMEWLVRNRQDKARAIDPKEMGRLRRRELQNMKEPRYPKDTPMRLLVRITGTGEAGLNAAAEAFVNNNLLNGVVLAGAEASEGPDMWTLSQDRYYSTLPFSPPANIQGYRYIGWLLPDAYQYDGFTAESGIKPALMYRIKYMPDFGIVNFWTSPHRRASQFEVCVALFKNDAEAKQAQVKLMESIKKTPAWKAGSIQGLNTEVVKEVMLIESIPELPNGAGRKILDAMADQIRQTKEN